MGEGAGTGWGKEQDSDRVGPATNFPFLHMLLWVPLIYELVELEALQYNCLLSSIPPPTLALGAERGLGVRNGLYVALLP